MKYETRENIDGMIVIYRTDDVGIVSMFTEDEANPDYQAYLAWLEENGSK